MNLTIVMIFVSALATTQVAIAQRTDTTSQRPQGVFRSMHYHIDRTSFRNSPIIDFAPTFPSGRDSFERYIKQYLWLSDEEADFIGRINLLLVVDFNGRVDSVGVLDSGHSQLADRLTRIVRHLPNWDPGWFDGQRVSSVLTIGIRFNKGNIRVTIHT